MKNPHALVVVRPAPKAGALISALLAAAILTCTHAAAQTPASPQATGATPAAKAASTMTKLDRGDRRFIEKAALGGMAEVELGALAEKRAASPAVREFGSQMTQDHGKANEELMALARARQVQPPAPDGDHRRAMERLSKLPGAKFDRAYMKHMVDDHKKDVAEFTKASKSAQDTEVRAFAARTLPTLQSHLQMAQTTYNGVNSTGK